MTWTIIQDQHIEREEEDRAATVFVDHLTVQLHHYRTSLINAL